MSVKINGYCTCFNIGYFEGYFTCFHIESSFDMIPDMSKFQNTMAI